MLRRSETKKNSLNPDWADFLINESEVGTIERSAWFSTQLTAYSALHVSQKIPLNLFSIWVIQIGSHEQDLRLKIEIFDDDFNSEDQLLGVTHLRLGLGYPLKNPRSQIIFFVCKNRSVQWKYKQGFISSFFSLKQLEAAAILQNSLPLGNGKGKVGLCIKWLKILNI